MIPEEHFVVQQNCGVGLLEADKLSMCRRTASARRARGLSGRGVARPGVWPSDEVRAKSEGILCHPVAKLQLCTEDRVRSRARG